MRGFQNYDEVCDVKEEFGIGVVKQRLDVTDDVCRRDFLLEAASFGNQDILQALIPYADSDRCHQALMCAVDQKRLGSKVSDVVKLLIPHTDCRRHDSAALVHAAKHNDASTFDLLLPHSVLNARNVSSILKSGITHHNMEIIKKVIPNLDDPNHASELLFLAVKLGHADVVELLLPRANLIVLWKSLEKSDVYHTDISHQSSVLNTQIHKCLELVNECFKDKMNYNIFSDIPRLDFYRAQPSANKMKA